MVADDFPGLGFVGGPRSSSATVPYSGLTRPIQSGADLSLEKTQCTTEKRHSHRKRLVVAVLGRVGGMPAPIQLLVWNQCAVAVIIVRSSFGREGGLISTLAILAQG